MIYGTNFGTLDAAGGVSVRIGGKPCLNATIWVDHFQIKCIAPPGVGADVDVGVWVPAEGKFGSQRCNSSVFDYTAPSISSVSRANTDGNESLTIEGFNLGSSLDATFNITIGGQPCRKPWVSKNHTKVSCYPPPGYGVLPLRLWIPSDPNHAQHTDSVFSYKAPEITSASPIDTDAPSKTVISGANFGPIGANVTVRINSVNCPNAFVQVAHKQIACSPPPGCGSSMKVEVLVPGLDHYASSNVFSYNAPKLDSTTSCDTKGGIPVILTGSNFGPLNSSVAVTIDGKICANASVSRAHVEITCIPPPGAGGLLPVQVSIPATSTGYSFPLSSTKSIFSYNVPTLSSAGGSGTDGRQEAIIYGSNFGPLGTNVGVKINGDVCSSARVKVAHTQIGCSPPVGAGAGLNVTVYIPDSDTAQTATAAIFSYDPPTISYTTKAPTNGQNRTKIYGTGFGPLNSSIGVFVGEAICKDARVETAHTMVSCFPPEGTGTDHTVIITVPNVGSGQQSAPGTFSYDSPVVLQATPANTTGDSKTIITGMNFGPLETVVSATIWGVECIHASVVFPHTEIECYPPPGVGCGNALQVYVPKGSAQSAYMTDYCYEKPVIETFPATQTLGEHIILKGINFGPGGVIYSIYVFIDSDDIFFSGTLINQTAILVHIPAGTGIHHTLAITVKGQKSNSILFDYQGPSIFSATATGTAGDEYTKITGLNFGPLSTQVHVTIGGEKCEDAQVTTPGSEISCLPPAGVGTNKTVRVTVPYDSPVSQTASAIVFSYQAPIIDFANAGSCSGELNISGANFGSVINKISVSVGHRTCTDLKFVLPNSGLKCQLPSNSQPWDEVIVTVASQHSSAYGLRCVKQKGKGLAIGLGVAGAFVFTAGLACIVVFAVLRRKKMNPEKEVAMSSLWTTMQEDDPSKEVFDESHSTAVSVTDFLLQVSVTSISLGLNGHRASVDQHLEETVILTNTSKKYISFKWFPPATYKINTLFEPAAGIIPPSGETRVKIGASILCTTALDSSLILAASVGHVYAERPLQHISLPIKIESKLSTKLDPDEIVLHPPPIGEGSFGFVYRGEWRGQQVAVKILKNQELGSAQIYKDFLNEIKTMESFRCPQIVGFVGAVHIKRRLAILTEFMELGSLTTTIANTKLSIKQKYKIALDTARGMNYLHQSGVIHRDLKTDNVLLCSLDPASAVCAKITDFGTTRDVQTSKEALQMTKAIGTPSYMSPEILQNANYDASTDTYSFAVLCYSLFVEKVPFGEDEFPSAWKIAEFVINGNRLPLPENKVPAECKTLITECWATAPTDRPPFSTVVTTLESLFASC
ncbi:protein serine/threonine kinase [Pelomyxa schiedti]|nr:protein serine/threonine kinase [Pelomyxa schiedti]